MSTNSKGQDIATSYLSYIISEEDILNYGIDATLQYRTLSKYYELLSDGEDEKSVHDTICRERILDNSNILDDLTDGYKHYLYEKLEIMLEKHLSTNKKLHKKYKSKVKNFFKADVDDNEINYRCEYYKNIFLDSLKKYRLENKNFVLSGNSKEHNKNFLNYLQEEYFKNVECPKLETTC